MSKYGTTEKGFEKKIIGSMEYFQVDCTKTVVCG